MTMKWLAIVFLFFSLTILTPLTAQGIPISYGVQYQSAFKLLGFLPVLSEFHTLIGARLWLDQLGGGAWLRLSEAAFQIKGYSLEGIWEVMSIGGKKLFFAGGPTIGLNPLEVGMYASLEASILDFLFLDWGSNFWMHLRPSQFELGIGFNVYFNSQFTPRAPDPGKP